MPSDLPLPAGVVRRGLYGADGACAGEDGTTDGGKISLAPLLTGLSAAADALAPICDSNAYDVMTGGLLRLRDALKHVGSWVELDRYHAAVEAYFRHPALQACDDLAASLATVEERPLRLPPSAVCHHPELEADGVTPSAAYAADCKCNASLQATVCCVPTAATITDHVMTGASTDVSEQCRSPGRVEELLNDAARLSTERRRDRDEGAAFDSAFQFFRECEEELHGKACTVDAHCSYGAACRYGACAVAEGAAEAEATLLCYVDRMDGETLRLLRRDLG